MEVMIFEWMAANWILSFVGLVLFNGWLATVLSKYFF